VRGPSLCGFALSLILLVGFPLTAALSSSPGLAVVGSLVPGSEGGGPEDGSIFIHALSSEAPSPLTIFGSDDRVRVTPTTSDPWRSIVKLYFSHPFGPGGMCSGAMLDLFHVLTAGHCVYLHDEAGWPYDAWATSVQVIPAMDGGAGPYGIARVTSMRTYTPWIVAADWRHDWAVLTLDSCIGAQTGWMDRTWAAPSSSIYTGTLSTAGYPGDLDNGLNMYRTTASGRAADEYLHWFYLDAAGGQSGSPVWEFDGTNRRIVSIVTYSDDGTGSNVGTRINQDKFNRINEWLNADAPAAPCSRPDLTSSGSSGAGFSPTVVAGPPTALQAWTTVSNEGTGASGSFVVSFYLSRDTAVATDDALLGTVSVGSIVSGGSLLVQWSGTLPAGLLDGSYWVGWIVDSDGSVNEIEETNNIAYVTAGPLTVDAAPPTGSIIINGGTPWTRDPTVTLTLQFSDATAGVTDVRYSNDGVFDSEPWELPTSEKRWTLGPSDGVKWVWYEIRDGAGNTYTASGAIDLDTTGPATYPQVSGTRAGSGTFESDVTVSLIATDYGSGLESTWYRFDSGVWTKFSKPFVVSGQGAHRVEFYSVDALGNRADASTLDFVISSSIWHEITGSDLRLPVLLAAAATGLIVAILAYRRRRSTSASQGVPGRARVPPPPPPDVRFRHAGPEVMPSGRERLPPPPPPDD